MAERLVGVATEFLEAYRGRETKMHELRQSMTCSQIAAAPPDTSFEESRTQIDALSDEEVPRLLAAVPEADLLDMLKALQCVWPCREPTGSARWVALAKVLIADPEATAGRKGRQLLEFVVNQVDQLDDDSCVALVEGLTDWERKPHDNFSKCLELLPKLLFKVAKMERVEVQRRASDTCYTGLEYRNAVIDTICRQKWPHNVALAMITTLRELDLSEEQIERALAHIKSQTKGLDLQELPPLVYQLLLFCTQGCRAKILQYLLGMFNALDSACATGKTDEMPAKGAEGSAEDELVHVEGTVIMHFTSAIRQDLALGLEFIRIVKAKVAGLTTFEVALLLSVSRQQRFSAKATDILRKAAELQAQQAYRRCASPWIESLAQLPQTAAVDELLRTVLRRSVGGWDSIVPGAVQFAVAMLDANAKKFSGDAQATQQAGSYVVACQAATMGRAVAKQIVQSSIALLELAFKVHKPVRDEILAQIFNRVLTREDAVPHFVALLERIAHRCSTDILDSIPRIKEALEYLGYMSSATAVSLIRALTPVLRLQPSLQDYLVIVLRKSIFSREPEARMVALDGFLFLAEHSPEGGASDALGLEIIGQLRRCMVQQVEMRERLYEGLCQVAANRPKLLDPIASALLPNIQRYWDDERGQLSVDRCLDDKGSITEPLPKLLRTVARCVYLAGGGSTTLHRTTGEVHSDLVTRSRAVLDRCLDWILKCAVEDFELDKETDFTGEDGAKATSMAKLAIGLYEVLLEYLLLCTDLCPASLRNKVFVIASRLEEITNLVRVNSKGGIGGLAATSKAPGRFRKTVPEETLLTLDASLKVLAMSARDGRMEGVDMDVCEAIFRRTSFMGQILVTAKFQVEQVKDSASAASNAVFHRLKELGALLMRQYLTECQETRCLTILVAATGKKSHDKSKSVEKPLSLLALKALETCVQTVSSVFGKEEISQLAEAVAAEMTAQSIAELPEIIEIADQHICKCALNFQDLLKDVLPQIEQNETPAQGPPMLMVNIISALRNSLRFDSQSVLLGWTKAICTEQPNLVESPIIVKAIVQSYLHLAIADEGSEMLATAVCLARDLDIVCPKDDEEDQCELEIAAHGIVTEDSAAAVIGALTELVKATCEEVEWCCSFIDQLLQCASTLGNDTDDPLRVAAYKDLNSVEDAALKRVYAVVGTMIPLSKVATHENGEPILEALTRVYRCAEFLAARVIGAKSLRKQFVRVMHHVGDSLNPGMYGAISSFAMSEEEKGSRTKVTKESRLIPTLIFHVEKVEASLIKIQKIPNSAHTPSPPRMLAMRRRAGHAGDTTRRALTARGTSGGWCRSTSCATSSAARRATSACPWTRSPSTRTRAAARWRLLAPNPCSMRVTCSVRGGRAD